MLSRLVLVAGGLVAAGGVVGYSYRKEPRVTSNPVLSSINASCKDSKETSVPDQSWNEHDYCFYCGRGGDKADKHSNTLSQDVNGKLREQNGSEFVDAIVSARALIKLAMVKYGIPGCVVAVMKDGKCVWSEGLGYADVENDVPCSSKSVMRIASISKSLTAVALLQLYQGGLVDLDAPIQKYVPEFPEKTYDGKKVNITLRLLMSHSAGIRHYKNEEKSDNKDGKEVGERDKGEFSFNEYYIKRHFDSIKDSLKLFSEDDLVCKPGSYHYSTHGWTLISAAIENVSGMPYLEYMKKFVFKPLGMSSTEADFGKKIIRGRSKAYFRRKNGSLANVPYVDLSYKWAGGGYLSNADDLVKFGNSILSCWQLVSRTNILEEVKDNCILQPATTELMLKPYVVNVKDKESSTITTAPDPPIGYGLGWFVRPAKKGLSGGRDYPLMFGHTGGAVGVCSFLGIFPDKPKEKNGNCLDSLTSIQPKGVVVAILFNLQEVEGLVQLGQKVAEEFLDIN